MPEIDPTVLSVIETVRSQFPNVPFLALGQTVFWDEPTKAIWRRLLDQTLPDATLVAGVHDTDYFAKTTAHVHTTARYAILPHDDGLTHDLWSAAGELSALFGSESVPTRHMFLNHGVPFRWLARSEPGGRFALTALLTTAWGWRAIVRTDSHNVVARDIPVAEIAPTLLAQLDWGFEVSLDCLEDEASRDAARQTAKRVRSWVENFLGECNQHCRLGELYQTILPRFYELLLGDTAHNLQTTTSATMFLFNHETYARGRFHLLDAFLNPATRAAARAAYDQAVTGSGIYPLTQFGPGAIPFDLVVPNMGRGTLQLTPFGAIAEIGGHPWRVRTNAPITTREALAAAIEDTLGPGVSLVGKAIALADMIAAEHIVLFNESGSGYTFRTRRMNDALIAAGFPLKVHPIVRLSYNTWDAAGIAPEGAQFKLPEHLAATFGSPTIGVREFSSRWRAVVAEQQDFLSRSRSLKSVRELLNVLERREPSHWSEQRAAYEQALRVLTETAEHSGILGDRIAEHQSEIAVWIQERLDLERRKGEDWRNNVLPLVRELAAAEPGSLEAQTLENRIARQQAIRATAFDIPIDEARERMAATRFLLSEFKRQRRLLERGPENTGARATLARITRDAEMAKAIMVRNAFQTIDGLEHTHVRPTAWWLPLVDRTGAWFDAMVAGTKARFEWLSHNEK